MAAHDRPLGLSRVGDRRSGACTARRPTVDVHNQRSLALEARWMYPAVRLVTGGVNGGRRCWRGPPVGPLGLQGSVEAFDFPVLPGPVSLMNFCRAPSS